MTKSESSPSQPLRVLVWGTYDMGKPRSRILIRGMRENGAEVTECHADVWGGIEDKSQVKGLGSKIKILLRWLLSYPMLVIRFYRAPRPDVVLIGYLGQIDALVLWPFAKLRGIPVVLDVFISLYNTIAEDRKLLNGSKILGGLVYAVEYLALHSADHLLMDTRAHAKYIQEKFSLPATRVHNVPVGAEPEHFMAESNESSTPSDRFNVLFYGQFIPLHGIETIIRAAALTSGNDIHWRIIGTGQEAEQIHTLLDQLLADQHIMDDEIEWLKWVEYPTLIEWLHKADIALGIFGDTDKARRVIPNKVYQILLAGRPLITADTPAARELLSPGPGIQLVPENNPQALADAVLAFKKDYPINTGSGFHLDLRERIIPATIGEKLLDIMKSGALDK